MYLPRPLISHLYNHLVRTHHALSPPVVVLVALEPDALCACRIFTGLLKRDYIPHKIKPISGYGDLAKAGKDLVQPMKLGEGGSGGVVVCLGVGGLVDLEHMLGLEANEDGTGGPDGIEVWLFDARRPWNLANVFGGPELSATGEEPGAEDAAAPTANMGRAMQRPMRAPTIDRGQLTRRYEPGQGGIIVYDDGDIQEELEQERDAWFALGKMPEVDEDVTDDEDDDHTNNDLAAGSEAEVLSSQEQRGRKRKSWETTLEDGDNDGESDKENARPRQRRRSNSSTPIISSTSDSPEKRTSRRTPPLQSTPPSNQQSSQAGPLASTPQPSARSLRRRLIRDRQRHEATIRKYHAHGTSYAEPISALMYSLASDLGREENDPLWLAIVGVSSTELYGRTPTGLSLINWDRPRKFSGWQNARGPRIRQLLRDEVRRLNPPETTESGREVIRGHAGDAIPIHARSSNDNSIRLSPEPRFLLIRHWSLYDSMLHSPYLSAKLHIWSDAGRRRLHKLLAKMGVSLAQSKQVYTHMDMELKKVLRERLLKLAPHYGLDGLVPPAVDPRDRSAVSKDGWGFVRSWGWKACLSAADVAVVIGAILEVSKHHLNNPNGNEHGSSSSKSQQPSTSQSQSLSLSAVDESQVTEDMLARFFTAYDALLSPQNLMQYVPLAQSLHRAILRTGTSLLHKRQIRHLRAFRLALIKEGPDLDLFTAAGALTKLALWLGEAIAEVEGEKEDAEDEEEQRPAMESLEGDTRKAAPKRRRDRKLHAPTPLVLGCLDESRGTYTVVGLGGGGNGANSGSDRFTTAAARRARQTRREARRAERAKEKTSRREKRARERAARREQRELLDLDFDGEEEDETETESDSSNDSSSSEDEDSADQSSAGLRNRFGQAFQEVVAETRARVKLDSFEHCVVEVKKEDLGAFLEVLSMKAVVG